MLPEEQSLLTRPITTRTSPARDFWPAIHSIKSPHHKKFFETNFLILETISTNGKLCWNLTHQQSHITQQPARLSESPLFNTTWWHSCAKLHNVHPCKLIARATHEIFLPPPPRVCSSPWCAVVANDEPMTHFPSKAEALSGLQDVREQLGLAA